MQQLNKKKIKHSQVETVDLKANNKDKKQGNVAVQMWAKTAKTNENTKKEGKEVEKEVLKRKGVKLKDTKKAHQKLTKEIGREMKIEVGIEK